MNATTQTVDNTLTKSVVNGILGGLAGGLVFGLMMAMMNMLPMVGMLIGQENAVIGFGVHMAISAFIGAVYGVVAVRLPLNWTTTLIAGVVNGVFWWVAGALIAMPLMLGMNEMVFVIGEMQWMSLMGHMIFGVIAAAVFHLLRQRG